MRESDPQDGRGAVAVQPTGAGDLPGLRAVLEGTGLFPAEMLDGLIGPHLAGEGDRVWLTCLEGDQVLGFCFAAPETLTDGTWNMLAIAVLPEAQGRGCGAALVRSLEAELRGRGQRILIADTSGTEDYAATRAFYRRRGYVEEARIREFWGPGDDKVVFWKALGEGGGVR